MGRRHLIFACLLTLFACASSRAGEPVITGPLVVSDRWPQCTDLATWTRDIMRLEGLEKASETAQARAFFRWLRLFNRMATGGMIQAYEGEHNRERYVTDAHKNLFVYGWGYCDTTSRIAEAAWREYKQDPAAAERVVVQHENGGYHTMYRLRLDGDWGGFDPRYGYFLIERDAPDARILDWAEVGNDANIRQNKTFRHRSAPFFEFFGLEWERAFLINECYFEDEDAWVKAGRPVECVFGNAQYQMGAPFHDMGFRLPKGTLIERFWDNTARKFYVPAGKQALREEPFLPSGRFYRVTENMLDGNWPKYDPNYEKAKPYLATVPSDESYNPQVSEGKTIGQAWGRITYDPDLSEREFMAILTPDSTLIHSPAAPHLRAPSAGAGGSATFDYYSPYILVDGVLEGELIGTEREVQVQVRTLNAKPRGRNDPDIWSKWRTLHSGGGKFSLPLGRERFDGRNASLHGVYRFQVRVAATPDEGREAEAGLKSLRLSAYFETGIMSIPQIFAGRNLIRFKVDDASAVQGPIRVTYRYRTDAGTKVHEKTLQRADFRNREAVYSLDAPGLTRCDSVSIAY